MDTQPVKKVKKPKKQKVKQGHKLVWLTLIIILIPVAIVAYVLFSSLESAGNPVEGNRFSSSDLNPAIQQSDLNAIQKDLMEIPGVENATITQKSASLRVHLNTQDGISQEEINNIAEQAWNIVNNYLPVDTYFTNTIDSKMYDLQIDAFNYIVDDSHPADGQIYIAITKTGAGNKTVDVLTTPKNQEITNSVQFQQVQTEEQTDDQGEEEYTEDEGYYEEYYE